MNDNKNEVQGGLKKAWVKPALTRIEAGSAENVGTGSPDGSRDPGPALS